MSPATINRRLRLPQLSPEEAEEVAEWRVEMRKAELALAKVRLAEAELAHGEESSLDPGEIDELIEDAGAAPPGGPLRSSDQDAVGGSG
jgi:hypothetical protein